MGVKTDLRIRAWQEQAGIEPALGERHDALNRLQGLCFDLIRICELEKSGIRDGDGSWYGSDPLCSLASDIGRFALPAPEAEKVAS